MRIFFFFFESHYLPLLLTLQIRQPNKKNSSLRWDTVSIRNWNPNNKIKTKTDSTTLSPPIFNPCCRFWSPIHADLRDLQQKFKANQNPHLIWERESKWEKERIEMRERERIHHCCCSKPPCHRHHSKPPHHCCQSPIAVLRHDGGWFRRVLLGVCFRWENLFLHFFFFLVKLFGMGSSPVSFSPVLFSF